MRYFVFALLAAVLLAACPASQSSRCKELCQRQITCIETLRDSDLVIDKNECTSACSALDRDPEGKKQVDAYAACVQAAQDCQALLACE